jgi:hypothetical protein
MEMFPLDGMEELAFSDISILLPVEEQWIQTKMDNKQSIEKRILRLHNFRYNQKITSGRELNLQK